MPEKNLIQKEQREWTFIFLGAALGSGILFIPLQMGSVSLITALTAMIIGIFFVYIGNYLVAKITTFVPHNKGYDDALTLILGKHIGKGLSLLYLLFLFTVIVIYGEGMCSNTASLLEEYHLASITIATHPLYILLVLIILAIPLLLGERFLLKWMEKVVSLKIAILIILILLFIPLWKVSNMLYYFNLPTPNYMSSIGSLLPLIIFGASFFPAIGSMCRALEERYPKVSHQEKFYYVNRSVKRALITFTILLVLFILSALFALSPESLSYAIEHNLTALSIISQNGNGNFISMIAIFTGLLVSLLAILTSFYAIILGLIDALILMLPRKIGKKRSIFLIFIFLYGWITLKINILAFIYQVISPLILIYLFFLPSIAVFKIKESSILERISAIVSFLIGLMMLMVIYVK